MSAIRLQKLLAIAGVASRRQAEVLIQAGRVSVNGAVITQLGSTADPDYDRVFVDGHPVAIASDSLYLLFNKPAGVVSTCADPEGRPTVVDFLSSAQAKHRLYPVGRLDTASIGAILLTNDGDFTLKLTHPRYHLPKTYLVDVVGQPSPTAIAQWRQGLDLDGQQTRPAQVSVVYQSSRQTRLKVVLREGRNRQIRRVAEMLGHPVQRLQRIAIGPVMLGDLPEGQLRSLTTSELRALRDAIGHDIGQ